jgi:broad specificity phosphatase PhoE
MTARLDLLAHGATTATRAAFFPDDESLEARAVVALEAARPHLRSYDRVLASPARAARETAAALGLDAEVEPSLRDCDYGRWRGCSFADVEAREPEGIAAWLGDLAAAPHGGESLAATIERTGAWLTLEQRRNGTALAITHASVIRAAIVSALSASAASFWRIDVAPLALLRLSGREGRWNLVSLSALGKEPR